ncbi:MAG: hypothetical protein PUC14_09300 [Bacteroidales bacterium]|nr:hypothetical protein [Bacteroidales bacterium]MDD5975899.1 hypothetical protein [Bacteroidales bacterium]MDY5193754.1 hypothetical protein [Candidatus Aphodosoma sp.]
MNIKRLLIINQCLKDNSKKWSLQDLIDACNKTGKNSKRSVQADLELMRNSEAGYNAPIKVVEKKYYSYDDKKYSLLNQSLTETDKQNILNALDVLYDYASFASLKNIDTSLFSLHEKIAISLNLPLPVKEEKENNTAVFVRLWVNYTIADEIIDKPIDESQKVELAEIDGSLILQLNTVINKKFEDYIAANSENIKVLTPNSLQAKIKKLING